MAVLDTAIRHVAFPNADAGATHRQIQPGIRLTQRFLGLPKVGDVRGGADEANGFSVRVAHYRATREQPAGRAVLGPRPVLVLPLVPIAGK